MNDIHFNFKICQAFLSAMHGWNILVWPGHSHPDTPRLWYLSLPLLPVTLERLERIDSETAPVTEWPCRPCRPCPATAEGKQHEGKTRTSVITLPSLVHLRLAMRNPWDAARRLHGKLWSPLASWWPIRWEQAVASRIPQQVCHLSRYVQILHFCVRFIWHGISIIVTWCDIRQQHLTAFFRSDNVLSMIVYLIVFCFVYNVSSFSVGSSPGQRVHLTRRKTFKHRKTDKLRNKMKQACCSVTLQILTNKSPSIRKAPLLVICRRALQTSPNSLTSIIQVAHLCTGARLQTFHVRREPQDHVPWLRRHQQLKLSSKLQNWNLRCTIGWYSMISMDEDTQVLIKCNAVGMPVSMTPLLALPPAANHPAGLRQRAPSAHGSPPVAETWYYDRNCCKGSGNLSMVRSLKNILPSQDGWKMISGFFRKISRRYHKNEMLIFPHLLPSRPIFRLRLQGCKFKPRNVADLAGAAGVRRNVRVTRNISKDLERLQEMTVLWTSKSGRLWQEQTLTNTSVANDALKLSS